MRKLLAVVLLGMPIAAVLTVAVKTPEMLSWPFVGVLSVVFGVIGAMLQQLWPRD